MSDVSDCINEMSCIEDKINNDLEFLTGQIIDLQAKVARLELRERIKESSERILEGLR